MLAVSGVFRSSTIIIFLSVSPLDLLVSALYILVFPGWVPKYWCVMSPWWIVPLILIKCPSLSLVNFFYHDIYYVWYKYGSTCFSLHAIFLGYHLPSLHFESMIVFIAEMGLLKATYIVGSYFLIHPANLHLLIGEFSWFTFRVNTDIWGHVTAILSFVFWLLCISIVSFSMFL